MRLPTPLRQLSAGWMTGSEAMGRIMSWILLTVLWVVLFGVYAVCLKIAALLRKKETPTTYWHPLVQEGPDAMKNPF
jgi:hypothetical protein